MYFVLYSHNIPVRGKGRSAIYDLHNANLYFIPNVLYEVLTVLNTETIERVKSIYTPGEPRLLDKYMEYLIANDLGFYSPERLPFPKMNLEWSDSSIITNAVVEHDFSHQNLPNLLQELDQLLCKHLEIRILSASSSHVKEQLMGLVNSLNGTVFKSVKLSINYQEGINEEVVNALYEINKKLDYILIFEAPFTKVGALSDKIIFTKDSFETALQKQQETKYFINIPFFTESQHYNIYYNRKVCIDAKGNVKNCLRHEKTFGNAHITPLKQIISTVEFQELWYASVDTIEGVKDSELRYCMFLTDPLRKIADNSYELIR